MTNVRARLSFPLAITRVVGLIGWDAVMQITNRSERAVRYWTESDKGASPTLDQALALDAAYRAAGGGGAPILESYGLQLEITLSASLACHAALAGDIATAATESADAIATSIAVTQPGAKPRDIMNAIAEAEEATGAMTRLLGRLKSFLPGTGAAQAVSGETGR